MRLSSFVRKIAVSCRAEACCCCMKLQIRQMVIVHGCLLTKEVFIYLSCVSSETILLYSALCIGAETLQIAFPSLRCQLPVQSILERICRWRRRFQEAPTSTCLDISGMELSSRDPLQFSNFPSSMLFPQIASVFINFWASLACPFFSFSLLIPVVTHSWHFKIFSFWNV